MKRNRITRNATKLISINNLGKVTEIDRNQCVIPSKNVFVPRDKVTHDITKRKAFQDISAKVAMKVERIKKTESELKTVKRLHRKIFMSNVDKMFKNALQNAPEVPENELIVQ